jgi:hypothetical protein
LHPRKTHNSNDTPNTQTGNTIGISYFLLSRTHFIMFAVSMFYRQSDRRGLAASFAFLALTVCSTNADGGRFGSIPVVGGRTVVLDYWSSLDSMYQGQKELLDGGQCRVTLMDEGTLEMEKKMPSGLYEEAWLLGRSYLGKHQDGKYIAELWCPGAEALKRR